MNTLRRSICIMWMVFALFSSTEYCLAEVPHLKIGKFPQEVATSFTKKDGLPSNDVRAVHVDSEGAIWADTHEGWAVWRGEKWSHTAPPSPQKLLGHIAPEKYASTDDVVVHQTALTPDGQIVVATNRGLLLQVGSDCEPLIVEDGLGRRWGTSDVRGVAVDSHSQLWFATLAGAACRTADGWRFYTGREGLPYNDFTVIEPGPNSAVWFGTHLGAIRFDGKMWAYRQGRRWLPNDDVRDIVIDRDGNAWFATAGGVGLIEQRMMTLAEKAEFYEEELDRYIRRTPFGYVSDVGLTKPGDKSSKIIYHADDNDGLWTAMYGAGECFAFAATGDAKAKDRARQVFEALRFLQKVPEGCEYSPPKGYVARTILSVDLPDPNIGRLERDRKHRAEEDALWKVYEPRWPKSADGKWYWKSDTSSDELDGHYFFYSLYYDLVADSESEKQRIREVVRDLTDYLIQHDFNIVDYDGTPARWGVYNPDSLNHDFAWWRDRGLKSMCILSYLAVAEHITGDPTYGRHIEQLMKDHAFDANAMAYKIHHGIGSGNHSDDEMAFMGYYNLVKYTKNEALRQRMFLAFFSAWANEQPEMNPFFNFAYVAFCNDAKYNDEWGTHSLAPWDGWLEDSVATLKGFPLDRLNWASKNSHRLDVVRLPRQNGMEKIIHSSWPDVGHLVNGKVLSVENRHFAHWNNSPWELDYDGDGHQLASGTVYLLPYYMGLYHGFIQEIE